MPTAQAGLVIGGFLVRAADPRPASVAVKPYPMSPIGGIHEAIDAFGADGGVLTIPPGEYPLRQSIPVRSDVTLQGIASAAFTSSQGIRPLSAHIQIRKPFRAYPKTPAAR
jgi:hypothetical protein